jgi:hypothetical protein
MRGGRRCSRQITSEHARPVLAQRTKVFASADVMAITKWSIGRNKRRPYAISLNESDLHLEFCLLPARDTIPGARNRTGKRHMKFVLVNGRRPRPQSFCALCGEAIGESYLRELTTRLSYCDHTCYAGHCKIAAPALQRPAKAS